MIYRKVLGRMPVALNRAGFTLLDQRSRKLIERYKLTLADFFRGEQALKERLSLALVPPELAAAAAEAKETAGQAMERLIGALRSFDVTLANASAKSQRKIEYQLDKMEKKVAREIFARDARAAEHASYLNGLIYPDRRLQERLYSILPFLAKHGFGLVDQIYDNVRLACPDHQLLVI